LHIERAGADGSAVRGAAGHHDLQTCEPAKMAALVALP
jgi:hypothetical protein